MKTVSKLPFPLNEANSRKQDLLELSKLIIFSKLITLSMTTLSSLHYNILQLKHYKPMIVCYSARASVNSHPYILL
jgi:hypothetical protein